jgi:hypothetical protein
MAQPPTLFDVPVDPLPVRSSDPATSRAAARRLPLRKRKAQVMHAISFLMVAAPGSFTADEVLDVLRIKDKRWERGWVASRLSQLKRDGLVEACGVAEGRMGADVSTFRLTAAGREWLAGEA